MIRRETNGKALRHRAERGSVLVITVIGLLLLAALTYALTRQGAMDTNIAATEVHNPGLRYAAEAAFVMAKTSVEAATGCTGYTNLAATSFGDATVSATVTPASGSPVTITATAAHNDGGRYTVTRDIEVLSAVTLVDQGGASERATYLADTIPTTNLNSALQLMVEDQGAGEKHATLQWDFSALPANATITNAELELDLEAVSSGLNETVRVHRITQDWTDDEASWNEHHTGQTWAAAGGDFDATVVASATANGAAPAPVQFDITALANDWATGVQANFGALLSVPNSGARVEFTSGNAASCGAYPKLTVTAGCPCGDTCNFGARPYPRATCEPAFIADRQSSVVDYAVFSSNTFGVDFIPPCWTVNGVAIPTDGAWLFNEGGILQLSDMNGTLLTTMPSPSANPTGLTLVRSGAWQDHIAVVDSFNAKIRFIDFSGSLQGEIDITAINDKPKGISFIDGSATGTYDGHFAVTSEHDPGGGLHGRVYIIDQQGNLATTIDVNANATRPKGVAHLPGTDKFLIADWWTTSGVIYDAAGAFYGSYSYANLTGGSNIEVAAFNPLTCEHVVASTFTKSLVGVSGTSCAADYLPNTQVRQYNTSAYDNGYKDGRTYLPEGVSVNGAAVLAGGAWLTVDGGETTALTLDVAGNVLDNALDPGINNLAGAAYVHGGTNQGRLAVITESNSLSFVHLSTGAATGPALSILTVPSANATGLSYIKESASGTYDEHLAIMDENERITIIDQAGTVVQSIDLSAISTSIVGVSHLAGTDRFAVVDTINARVVTVDMSGALIKAYTHSGFGLDSARSIAVNGTTCDHSIGGLETTSGSSSSVIDINFIDGNTSPPGTYRSRFPIDNDAYAYQPWNDNYGAEEDLESGKSANKFRHAFAAADLSTVPTNGVINFARLHLFLDTTFGSADTPFEVYRTTEAWDESTMNWNSWSNAGGTYDSTVIDTISIDLSLDQTWHSWDVGSLVQSWTDGTLANEGVAIIPGNSSNNRLARFASSDESTVEERPYFDVEYSVP